MIITRTPYRLSFFGGGTDYPAWYQEHGGAVLATTIDKYCYISCRYLPPFFEHKSRVIYSKIEMVNQVSEIVHPPVRECLKYLNIDKGVEIHHDGDLPARTGVGSSSSFTVGLLHALYSLIGEMPTKRQLCLDAIHLEQKLLKENVGSQDQTLAAFGGFNLIKFGGADAVTVLPVTISLERLTSLKSHLMLFFTGFSRTASHIASEQIHNIPQKKEELSTMFQMVDEGLTILNSKSAITEFGKLLHESWKIKRSLSSKITLPIIDEIYEVARSAGAIGGKLIGAGGGGFLLIFAEPKDHPKIKNKLKSFLHVPFNFETLGSQVIYYAPTSHNYLS